MENAIVVGPLKQVGNSLCLFIPAEVKDELHLKPQEQVVAEIRKKKKKIDLLGITKGKLGPWVEKEDRLDARK